jgi:hypothetical protein
MLYNYPSCCLFAPLSRLLLRKYSIEMEKHPLLYAVSQAVAYQLLKKLHHVKVKDNAAQETMVGYMTGI